MTDARWFVIINPTSGNGKAKKVWPKIKHLLKSHSFKFDFSFTKNAEDNVTLVYNAVNQNIKNIICVGGDGTIHNTVNGIMTQSKFKSSEIILGVIPVGTGNDWIKTHSISKEIEAAILTIKNGKTLVQDIGKIEFKNSVNKPIYFNNLAGIGYDGYVVSKVGKYKYLGAISYLLGSLSGLFSFKNFDVIVNAANKKYKARSLMVLIGLCKFSGGGMRLTNYSNYYNGVFDISLVKNLSKVDMLVNMTKLYNGKITEIKKVEDLKTNKLLVDVSSTKKLFVQADGELVGEGSFKVTMLPKALRFYCK